MDSDDYLQLALPKTTGREHYSAAFAGCAVAQGRGVGGLTGYDKIATAHGLYRRASALRWSTTAREAGRLIVGGGGSHNLY